MNSSETAETKMMREEPRQRPARVKVEEAAMKKCVLVSWARMVSTEETHSRLKPMMAIRRQYLITEIFQLTVLSRLVGWQCWYVGTLEHF